MKWSLPVPIAAAVLSAAVVLTNANPSAAVLNADGVQSTAAGARAHPGHGPAGATGPEPGGAGHHAIGEIYDEERTIVLAGKVESFLFGNPHSLLHVRVENDGGRARTWAVEWRAANRLSRAGLTGDALAPGDPVALCGHPGRNPAAYRLYLLNVARRAADDAPASDVRETLCEREARPEIARLP